MKADFKKWADRKYGETIDIPYFQTLPFKDINQFAEDYAEKERKENCEEAFDAGVVWGNDCGNGYEPHFDEWYNQKFNKDE